MARDARCLGERAEEVELPALRHWLPDITPRVRRALHLPDDHRVDNVQLCAVLAQAAQKLGVVHPLRQRGPSGSSGDPRAR